jgi:HEAT repeat protein
MKYGAAAIPALLTALRAKNRYVRRGAAAMLAELRAAEAVEPIIGCLQDSDAYVLISACMSLASLEDRRAIAPLWALVERDPASINTAPVRHCGTMGAAEAKQSALVHLVHFREMDALLMLIDQYRGKFSLRNMLAGLAYKAQQGDEAAREMITRCAEHPDSEVRQMVQAALGQNSS